MQLLRSRLVHFAVLGGAIFAVAPRPLDERRIELRSTAFDALAHAEATRRSLAALPDDKTREVRARAIEDELLYREAIRLGLDRDDPIIRQRLAQKLLLLVEDMGGASNPPTDAELRAFFDEDRARFRRAPRVHLIHVFATRESSLPGSDQLPENGIPQAGEPFPYSRDVRGSRDDLARVYGDGFATAVAAIEPSSRYSAPIASTFGWHRVRVVEREPGRIPDFDEVKAEIALDYEYARRERIVGAWLKKVAGDYRIVVDGRDVKDFVPTRRIALPADPSAED
jgi:hypothetical protein